MFQTILGWLVIAIGAIILFYGIISFGEVGTLFSDPDNHEKHSCRILLGLGFLILIYGIDIVFF